MLKAGAPEAGDSARPAGFLDGAVLLVLNPKAYLIIALVLTQFLSRSEGGSLAAILSIATVFTLNNLMAFLASAAIGNRIAASLRTPAAARRLNRMFGTILAPVAVMNRPGGPGKRIMPPVPAIRATLHPRRRIPIAATTP